MRVLVVRTILSLLRIDTSMPLRLSAVIQSMMIFFFSEKHVYTRKKRDFKACTRCSYDPVITTHGRQYVIAAFRHYSVEDDMFFFSLKNTFMHVKNAILTRALVGRTILSLLRINSSMPLRLSAVIQSMIFFFFSEKHVYTCKKRDFNVCACCPSGYVTA